MVKSKDAGSATLASVSSHVSAALSHRHGMHLL